MLTVGEAGSQAAAIARDLIHLADIKILHGQRPGVAAELDTMLGLGPHATETMTGWAMHRKGRALWLVGEAPTKSKPTSTPSNHLTFTNEALDTAA